METTNSGARDSSYSVLPTRDSLLGLATFFLGTFRSASARFRS